MAAEELAQDAPQGTEPAAPAAPAEMVATDEVVADELVEDVSIDGMCGVY